MSGTKAAALFFACLCASVPCAVAQTTIPPSEKIKGSCNVLGGPLCGGPTTTKEPADVKVARNRATIASELALADEMITLGRGGNCGAARALATARGREDLARQVQHFCR